ncbi:MAG: hypothetical protein U7M05_06510 [Candidatus Igneacidithiobacillus chanchocoensis]
MREHQNIPTDWYDVNDSLLRSEQNNQASPKQRDDCPRDHPRLVFKHAGLLDFAAAPSVVKFLGNHKKIRLAILGGRSDANIAFDDLLSLLDRLGFTL